VSYCLASNFLPVSGVGVYPLIKKSLTVEALNVNKAVNQSEKAVFAGFQHRNRAAFCSTPETRAGKKSTPGGMKQAPLLL